MPRRGRSASPPPAPRRSAPAPARAPAPAPAPAASHSMVASPPPSAVGMAAPQQPSMFKQMAATAGGVAIGSAVGHTLGHAMTGMFSGGDSDQAPAAQQQSQQQQPMGNGYASQQEGSNSGPCGFEIQQFIQCAQGQSDLTLCEGFNEAIRQCKARHNVV